MESSLSSEAVATTNLVENITTAKAESKKAVAREVRASFARGEHAHAEKRAEKRSGGKAADMKHADMCDGLGNVLGYSAMLSVCPKLSFTGAQIKGAGGAKGVRSSCSQQHQQLIPLPNTKVGSLEIYARFPRHYDYLMSRHDCSQLGDLLEEIVGKLNLPRIGGDNHQCEHTTEGHPSEKDSLSAASPMSVPNPIEGYPSLSLLDLGCGTGRISRLMLSRFAGGSTVNQCHNDHNGANHSSSSSSSSVLLTHIVGYDKYGPMLRVFDEMIEGDLQMREQQQLPTPTPIPTGTPAVAIKKAREDDDYGRNAHSPLRRKLIRVEFPTEEERAESESEAIKDNGFSKKTLTPQSLSTCSIESTSSKGGCSESIQRTEDLLSRGQGDSSSSLAPLYVCLRPASYEALRTLPRRTSKGEKRMRTGSEDGVAAERETDHMVTNANDAPKAEIDVSSKASTTREHAKEGADDQSGETDVVEHILWPKSKTASSDKGSQQTRRDHDASRHWPMDVAVMAWSLSYVMRAQWGVDTWHASVDALLTNLLTGPFGVRSTSSHDALSSSKASAERGEELATHHHNVDVSLGAQGKDGAISQAFAEVCRILSSSSSSNSNGRAEANVNAVESLENAEEKESKGTASSQQHHEQQREPLLFAGRGDIFPLLTLLPSSSAHLDRIPRGPPRAAIVVIETLGNNTSVPTRRNVISEYLMARWGFVNALFHPRSSPAAFSTASKSEGRDTAFSVSNTASSASETLTSPPSTCTSSPHVHESSESSGSGSVPTTPPVVVPFIRTDYVFNTLEEGEKLCNFFFASSATAGGLTRDDNAPKYRLKECTGVWVKYIW